MPKLSELTDNKYSKESVSYVEHSPKPAHCAICKHYQGNRKCELVNGRINPAGWCNKYEKK